MNTPREAAIVGAATTLMDGLLDEEDAAFDKLDQAVQRTADATRERVVAATRVSPARLARAELLPDDDWLGDVLLPPVSELVALARERALAVVEQQLRMVADQLGVHALPVASAGRTAAREAAVEVERAVFATAGEAMTASTAATRQRVADQRRTWLARHEEPAALIARLCSAERVALPGAGKGAVWQLRTSMNAIARAASVETVNALLVAGMRGWNDAADTT